ncbi:hypothetical protein A0J61_04259 [Choanephora cucurbitarum]|uniref:Myb-like domain-containing protein n=1 Tax=Choanephora cucurbitarum TaxID=101091 RepID=A0A1C7NF04_9FUNG|nr:hypothetical protein A0J61_04259 [Choanephora cucurbitarum]
MTGDNTKMNEATPMDISTETDDQTKQRQEWVKRMRLKFCVREEFAQTKDMIFKDGTLNQEYFRPPKDAVEEQERKWTETERKLLIQGIEQYGIGHFGEISKELLPKWSTNELRIKCIRLIGRQNLQLYRDWKGNADDIAQEYEFNKKIGLEHGGWKQGVLVYDDEGRIEKALLEHHQK